MKQSIYSFLQLVYLTMLLIIFASNISFAQDLQFKKVIRGDNNTDYVLSIAQDKYGFIWITRQLEGLQRYDGHELKSIKNDPENSNSPASNYIESFIIDQDNIFWLGTAEHGLDRYDPATNTFTHYRHNEKDKGSLISDRINVVFADKAGNIWIGTYAGLDRLDKKTGAFTHFANDPTDKLSLSYNEVRTVYEDHAGTIWVGCGRPFFSQSEGPEKGGLNKLNKETGKFTRYMHEKGNPASLEDNKVRAIFEDSKGNFWIGTRGDGLHIMDREKGTFKHYHFDPAHPEKLSRPPQIFERVKELDHISFITEDATGRILICAFQQGINYFNPADSTVRHYGVTFNNDGLIIKSDSATGLSSGELWKIFHSREGIMWMITLSGDVYTIRPGKTNFSYSVLNAREPDANTLYCEPGGKILWIGTEQGLFRKDLQTGAIRNWRHDPEKKESLCNDTIASIRADNSGKLWLATIGGGLTLFDPVANTFKTWTHDIKNPNSLLSNTLNYLFIDREKNLWIGSGDAGVDRMNSQTGTFTHFKNDSNNSKTLCDNYIYQICEDREGNIWVGTSWGLDKIIKTSDSIVHYLPRNTWNTVLADAKGEIWTASIFGSVFRFDSSKNNFQSFRDITLKKEISKVINIIEDKQGNLWLSQEKAVVKLDKQRQNIKIYDQRSGIHFNVFSYSDNFVNEKGDIFLGDQSGYYQISPELLDDSLSNLSVIFTSFSIGEEAVAAGKNRVLNGPVEDVKEIKMKYDQNTFSFDFVGINYMVDGDMKYLFRLEDYDKEWHNSGTEHRAYYYNVPPGNYILKIKAVSEDGTLGEKSVVIKITPPWWNTWWAYLIFAIIFIALIWGIIHYRSRQLITRNRMLENKVTLRTKELQNEKEKVLNTLTELKMTQKQLIQSEKMASLGQLTAGIAHEIQNPLNFVNNFSEVNKEMINELQAELKSGNTQEAIAISNDIKGNEEKINHHGKRAEEIVKGMLQHSRGASGIKEATDINSLCDEYLRLSYSGFRNKDNSFRATIETDFDNSIDKINVVPQDIGRVLLNIFNNAFYAVDEKKKHQPVYDPTINVVTTRLSNAAGDGGFEIKVSDNGVGIPKNIVDKIFQPFFTTKPTGQGTGLGLSLSYDIITKGHNGELLVESMEGEGSTFIIKLPA